MEFEVNARSINTTDNYKTFVCESVVPGSGLTGQPYYYFPRPEGLMTDFITGVNVTPWNNSSTAAITGFKFSFPATIGFVSGRISFYGQIA